MKVRFGHFRNSFMYIQVSVFLYFIDFICKSIRNVLNVVFVHLIRFLCSLNLKDQRHTANPQRFPHRLYCSLIKKAHFILGMLFWAQTLLLPLSNSLTTVRANSELKSRASSIQSAIGLGAHHNTKPNFLIICKSHLWNRVNSRCCCYSIERFNHAKSGSRRQAPQKTDTTQMRLNWDNAKPMKEKCMRISYN